MIQCRDRAGFTPETLGILDPETLDRDETIDTWIARLPHLTHPACADRSHQDVGAERHAGNPIAERHRDGREEIVIDS